MPDITLPLWLQAIAVVGPALLTFLVARGRQPSIIAITNATVISTLNSNIATLNNDMSSMGTELRGLGKENLELLRQVASSDIKLERMGDRLDRQAELVVEQKVVIARQKEMLDGMPGRIELLETILRQKGILLEQDTIVDAAVAAAKIGAPNG